MKFAKLLAGTVLALGVSGAASAAPIIGTFAGNGVVTTPGVLINVGSSLALTGGFATVGTGDLSTIVAGNPITGLTNPFTLSNGNTFDFTLTGFGSFTGTTSGTLLTPGSDEQNRTIRFFGLGEFAPTFGGFTAGPASITGAFTQSGGADGAVSFSFSFASPPQTDVLPAPATLALFGLGLVGIGLAKRRAA